MAVDHWGYWEQVPSPPAMTSTPKVPDVTMTMSKQVHRYARNEGAQNRQARKRQKRVTAREWRGGPYTKGGLRVSPSSWCLSHVMNIAGILCNHSIFSKDVTFQSFNHYFRKCILNIS